MQDTVVSASSSLESNRESRTPDRQKQTNKQGWWCCNLRLARLPWLHGKFEADLGHMRFCFKKININKYLQLG